ncbi:eukaryotic translation initiation factor eIF2A-domain-containing protein [Gigaspora rosea]|uniref:Eukaryotic translation initiation factor 2A n=1 Tax=Gigaspora rosea TaxID=44941 RepID=A0A397VSJ1_9GLOM|nr:eukaryotic translation initiation factor eIF2A-domain-containing protein [Gigaspora rosea]
MTTVSPTQLTYRSFNNLSLVSGHPIYQTVKNFQDGNIKTFQYSKDGRYISLASPEIVKIIDSNNAEPRSEIEKKNIVEIGFSPKGTYISTWERPVKLGENLVHKNLIVWETATAQMLIQFTQKSQANWNVQWTEDESFFSRMVTGEVHFYDSKRIEKGIHTKLRLENIVDFSLSPGKNPSIAVFIPEKNGAPASVRIYSITNFNSPLAQKTFFKADKVRMHWNDLGTNLLVLTQTEVDKTNKSYYGESNLYFLSVAGNYDCCVQLKKDGPIHDVAWSPNSKEFIVVYGYMPANATLFDHRANPIHEFGVNPPGFGNLAGTIDIWDRENLKKISTIEAPNSSECFWSPDGRYIMTATLSPRLRVDNGYKIWHYTGVLVHDESIQELLQVQWRPASVELYPMRTLSPPPKVSENSAALAAKPSPKKVGAYRPPHARGTATPDMFKREDEASKRLHVHGHGNKPTPVGVSEVSTKAAVKNKKKREAAKKKKEEAILASENSGAASPLPPSSVPVQQATNDGIIDVTESVKEPIASITSTNGISQGGSLSETDKKIRNLTKKLRQITELKERQQKGDKLELTQLQKIATEAALRKELDMLKP